MPPPLTCSRVLPRALSAVGQRPRAPHAHPRAAHLPPVVVLALHPPIAPEVPRPPEHLTCDRPSAKTAAIHTAAVCVCVCACSPLGRYARKMQRRFFVCVLLAGTTWLTMPMICAALALALPPVLRRFTLSMLSEVARCALETRQARAAAASAAHPSHRQNGRRCTVRHRSLPRSACALVSIAVITLPAALQSYDSVLPPTRGPQQPDGCGTAPSRTRAMPPAMPGEAGEAREAQYSSRQVPAQRTRRPVHWVPSASRALGQGTELTAGFSAPMAVEASARSSALPTRDTSRQESRSHESSHSS